MRCALCALCAPLVQALALKESSQLRGELEDLKAALARVKASYAELEADKAREVLRLKVGAWVWGGVWGGRGGLGGQGRAAAHGGWGWGKRTCRRRAGATLAKRTQSQAGQGRAGGCAGTLLLRKAAVAAWGLRHAWVALRMRPGSVAWWGAFAGRDGGAAAAGQRRDASPQGGHCRHGGGGRGARPAGELRGPTHEEGGGGTGLAGGRDGPVASGVPKRCASLPSFPVRRRA